MSAGANALARRWNGFWFEEVDPRPLAAFRIAFGTYLLLYFLRFAGAVPLLFSEQGVSVPYLREISPAPAVAYLLYGLQLLSLVAFTVGYRVRIATPLAFALFLHHYELNLAVRFCSFDHLNLAFLGLACFAVTDARWAVGATPRASVVAWPQRLMLVQLLALYLGAGLWKLQTPHWHGPEMLRNTLQGMWATEASFWVARQPVPDWIYQALAWGTIGFELALPFALVWRRTRTAAIAAGTLFHLANTAFLFVPEFLVCLVAYLLLWQPRARPEASHVGPASSMGFC